MYKIYMLTFPNNKRYIGCTKTKINYRTGMNGSKYTAKDIKNAIYEFGWKNIKQSILIDNLNYDEAKYYEKFYIDKYKTTDSNFGYNKHKGGGIPKKIKTYNHIMTPLKKQWIKSLVGKPLSEEHKNNIREGHLKRLKHLIVQYDLNNDIINKWNSICEIQRELGFKKQAISSCCFLNETKPNVIHTAYNFIWKKEKKS